VERYFYIGLGIAFCGMIVFVAGRLAAVRPLEVTGIALMIPGYLVIAALVVLILILAVGDAITWVRRKR
jgi:hypothetical protein